MTANRNNIHVRSEAGGRDTGAGNPLERTAGRASGEEEIRDFGSMELDEQVTEASAPRRGDENADDSDEDDDIEDVDFELDDEDDEDEDLDDADDLEDEDDSDDMENLNDQHNDESTSHMDYNGNSNESRPNR